MTSIKFKYLFDQDDNNQINGKFYKKNLMS